MSKLTGKPVLINFWASWCPPCKSEMPALQKVWEHYQAEGVMVLAINATYQDSSSAAADFAKKEGLSFPILLDSNGFTNPISGASSADYIFYRQVWRYSQDCSGGPMSEAFLASQFSQLLDRKP